jgi:outer membrane protein assembly factor BamA
MKNKRLLLSGKSSRFYTCASLILLIFLHAFLIHGETLPVEEDTVVQQGYPEKLGNRSTFEHIVNFPGLLLFIPFNIFFTGTEWVVGYTSESAVIRKLTSGTGERGVTPKFSSSSGFGVKLFQKNLINQNSQFDLTVTEGIRRRQMYRVRFRDLHLSGESLKGGFLIRYLFQPDESFFGIGPGTQLLDETNFAIEQSSAEIALSTPLSDRILLNGLARFDFNNVFGGKDESVTSIKDVYSKSTLPGFETEVMIGGVKGSFLYDSRNHKGNPSTGVEAFLSGGVFQQVDDDRFGFWKSSLELKKYFNLFYDRILVLRIAGEVTEELSGDREIPFYYLSELGSWSTVRGYQRGRFRDEDFVLGSIEYRYPVYHDGVDVLIFFDAGQVSHGIFDELSADDFRAGGGFGVRFWNENGSFLGFEVGRSPDGFRFHFKLN